jgi:DNA-binding SARP family transcriptional activator
MRLVFVQRLAESCLDAGRLHHAIALADRGIAIDELDEQLWRIAMRAEGALDMRQHVERRFDALRDPLLDRLGLQPQRETVDIYRRALGSAADPCSGHSLFQ